MTRDGWPAAAADAAAPDEDADFRALVGKIAAERAFSCGSYKDGCVRRRVAVRMRACGARSYREYMTILDARPAEYEPLLDALTVNVTKLFRNPEAFDALARLVVPELWSLPTATLRVWSAGCASGDEPYSLGVLFHHHAASRGELAKLDRVRVIGSDIDRASLAAAATGSFADAAFADTLPELRTRYFGASVPARIDPAVRDMVSFERRDLLLDPPPPGRFHLVVCRNVVIYFDRATQEALFSRLHAALLPGAFLFLGKVETVIGPARSMFAPVDQRARIFRRR